MTGEYRLADAPVATPPYILDGVATSRSMASVRRLVVDVLKPHDPPLVAFTTHVAEVDGVSGVSASLIELDQEVQNVKLTFEGDELDFEAVSRVIEDLGGTVHSVDQVACGEYVVEERRTLQDG
jgi:hypothetical protein